MRTAATSVSTRSRYRHISGRRRRHHPDHRRTLVRGRRGQPVRASSSRTSGPLTSLEENMTWLAESLGAKGSETRRRRRFAATWPTSSTSTTCRSTRSGPIYWLFSSGKRRCLPGPRLPAPLQRRHAGRGCAAEYVIPLLGKMVSRLSHAGSTDMAAATSSAARTKLQKQSETLAQASRSSCWPSTRSCATTPTCASRSTSTTA